MAPWLVHVGFGPDTPLVSDALYLLNKEKPSLDINRASFRSFPRHSASLLLSLHSTLWHLNPAVAQKVTVLPSAALALHTLGNERLKHARYVELGEQSATSNDRPVHSA